MDQYNSGDASYWQLDREYDAHGNLWKEHQSTSGLSTRTTVYSYDDQGIHLLNITDPAGRETGYTYDTTTGMKRTETDLFGNLTTYQFNSADQLDTVIPEGGITTTIVCSLNVTAGPANARYSVQETGSDGSWTRTWYDKLDRAIRKETKSFGGTIVKADRQYNAKGQLYRVSEPTTGTPSQWNVTGYDDFGRVVSEDPYYGATSTYSYSGTTTTKTVNGLTYISTDDAAGLTTGRTDPGGEITYAYLPDGLLKSALTPGNVTTSMTYNRNGNRLILNDPSAGITTDSWYGTGEIRTHQNARGQTTTYTYQSNGFLDYYTSSPLDEGEANYSYNSDGQISSITSPGGVSRSYSYDSRGRADSVTESIDGVSNTVSFSYDSSGRLYRKYFNGTTDYEQYDYNANGYLYRIQFNGTIVWEIAAMDNYGRITQAGVGGTTCTWGYDSNNMLSQVAAAGVQQYDYSFNVNTGNLNSRTNSLKSLSESFGYDALGLDRLTSVTGPANLTVGYTSGNNGNIQSKSDAGTYAYNNTPYAVSDITGALNISATPQEIDYYSFEKVKTITEGTKTAEFVYNAGQQRIRMILKNNGTVTKTRWYFGSSLEREVVGSTTTQYIWIGGDAYSAVAVARKVGSGSWEVFSVFRDHLGTITHLKSGSTLYEYSFDAWGRRRDKDNWGYTLSGEPELFAGRGFTAHEHLEDFNLVNMNGRLYDPVVGRFLSPDPYVQNPGATQDYNRYSYCLNNPLKFTDPQGYKIIPMNTNDQGNGLPTGMGASSFPKMGTILFPAGTGLGMPGYGLNGPGLGGVYYDWSSDSYRDMYGQVVSWGQVSGLISNYEIRLPNDAILSSIRMNNQGVWYQTVSVGAQERIGLPGSPFNASFSVDVVNAFIGYNAANGGGLDWFNIATDYTGKAVGGASLINGGVKAVAKEYVRQVGINQRLAGITNGKLPNSYSAVKNFGNKIGVVGGLVIAGDILYNSEINVSHGINAFMTGIAFTGWGAPIAGLWFVADFGTGLITGTSISDRIDANTGSLNWDW